MHNTTIILPSKFTRVREEGTTGVYDIEGLYPGYGHTLGNSLRRIIYSSLQGSAMTLVKIDGAEHEYSTLPGVKEDVLAILLNLKRVRFQSLSDEPQVVTLKVKGIRSVTAADIDGHGTVEVLNPDQHIAEITTAHGSLSMEITIERGVGFIPRDVAHHEKLPISTIGVDAIYTPIRKVSYEVDNMRVGDRTDYNRLRLTIQTDGTMTPAQALEESIKIMIHQLRSILDLTEEDIFPLIPSHEPQNSETMSLDTPELNNEQLSNSINTADILKTRIESINLSTRTMNALSEASIRTIGGLVKKTEEDLLDVDGLGAKAIEEIKTALVALGVSLKR